MRISKIADAPDPNLTVLSDVFRKFLKGSVSAYVCCCRHYWLMCSRKNMLFKQRRFLLLLTLLLLFLCLFDKMWRLLLRWKAISFLCVLSANFLLLLLMEKIICRDEEKFFDISAGLSFIINRRLGRRRKGMRH